MLPITTSELIGRCDLPDLAVVRITVGDGLAWLNVHTVCALFVVPRWIDRSDLVHALLHRKDGLGLVLRGPLVVVAFANKDV